MKNDNADIMMNRPGFRLDQASEVLYPESLAIPEFFTQCCVCKKVKHGESWVRGDDAQQAVGSFSHGYCPDCFRQVLRHINKTAEGAEYFEK